MHERGAPHLIDPARLIESATRLYGERDGAAVGRGAARAGRADQGAARRRAARALPVGLHARATPPTTSPTCTSRAGARSPATSRACASARAPCWRRRRRPTSTSQAWRRLAGADRELDSAEPRAHALRRLRGRRRASRRAARAARRGGAVMAARARRARRSRRAFVPAWPARRARRGRRRLRAGDAPGAELPRPRALPAPARERVRSRWRWPPTDRSATSSCVASTAGRCPSATTSRPTSATATRRMRSRWSTSATTASCASCTGASCRRSPTRPPTCSPALGVERGRPRRGRAAGRRPRRRRSSSRPGSSARSCCRCRCCTATRASRTGCATPSRRCSSPTRRTRRASTGAARSAAARPRPAALARRERQRFETLDTSADDPAQLYYTSGTTGLAKGIVHAHRYLLAHNEFVHCHDVQAGERFHGMGEWAWAAGICPLLGPWRLGAVQARLPARGRLRPAPPARLPLAPRGHERLRDADGDPLDDVDRRRARALPAALPGRLLGGRAAEPRGDPLVPRPVRGDGARLLRPHGVLSAVRQLPLDGGPRGVDGTADAGLGRRDPRRGRAPGAGGRARRDLPARALEPALPARLLAAAGGERARRSAASGSTPRTPRAWTRTATSGTRGAPTT